MKIFRTIVMRLLLAGNVFVATAATASVTAPMQAIQPAHELNASDAEAWLDGFMENSLRTTQTPGAVVVIVKDGQVLLEKGYGYANVSKHIPVDPRNTLFRPGSTSKLFTWTAVMQLVEKGQLNLDADVNTYLDFYVPPRHGKPLTLRQIMTHRTGFEETVKDLLTFGRPPKPLDQILKGYIPPRFADADTVAGYSNYGCALAGYIVQRVSGIQFEEYIEKNIFAPLGMNSSSFRQPLPTQLLERMATGYETSSKVGLGYENVNLPPAGSLASTGDDMARFMIAHLEEGAYNNAEILKPATAHMMHDSVSRLFPDLNGNLLGFYEDNINGRRVISHGGDTQYFHSDLALFLNEHVGIFISVNAPGKDHLGAMIREDIFTAFADRYYPKLDPAVQIDASIAKEHANLMAGKYISTRRADSTFLSIVGLISPTEITANQDGSITTKTLLEPETYVEVQPFLWKQIDGHDKLQAIVRDGKVVRWSTNILAFGFAFEHPDTFLSLGAQQALSLIALTLLTLSGLFWPISAFARKAYNRPLAYTGTRALAYHLKGATAFLPLVTVTVWFVFLNVFEKFDGTDPSSLLVLAQIVASLALAAGIVVAIWNLALELREHKTWPTIVWTSTCLAAFVFLTWIAVHYHLVGFYSQY